MCTLISALTAVSAGASLYKGYAEGQYAMAQADAQADALERNADISRQQGHDAVERGGMEELRLRRQLANLRANQRTQAAASGIDINSGSALDLQNASISEGEFDAETIRFNAARAKWGYDSQANNMDAQAINARAIGRSARTNALIGGVADAFGTVGGHLLSSKNIYSPLSEQAFDDRSKYWGPIYNSIERKRRGYA